MRDNLRPRVKGGPLFKEDPSASACARVHVALALSTLLTLTQADLLILFGGLCNSSATTVLEWFCWRPSGDVFYLAQPAKPDGLENLSV